MKRSIKTILSSGDHSTRISLSLLMLRLSIGGLMLTHGLPKLLRLFGEGPISFSDPLGVGIVASLSLAVFAEAFCSMLLILGLATRLATIPLLITMGVAVLVIHAQDPLGKKELPLLYMLIYITIAILGAGKFSIDHWLTGKKSN